MKRWLSLVALLLALASPAAAKPDMLILVSIDGFRADYLDRGLTPVLSALARQGATGVMRPSYPSLTFPNHYTLVTGLYPDHHGIVDNTMDDPVLGHFSVATGYDPRWWDQAEPIWITADRRGLRTASVSWPGSDRIIQGGRPDYWLPYRKDVLADARIDQLLAWIDLPQGQRPDFAALYFDLVDTAGHKSGPDSPELNATLPTTDAAMGRLVQGLQARGLYDRVNLIVVSDHGMASTSMQRVIYLDDWVEAGAIHMTTAGTSAGLSITAQAPADTEAKLLAIRRHARCWRKADLPMALHFGQNPRIPPIVCLAEVGWSITTHQRMIHAHERLNAGSHGYRPDVPQMAALFIARGPAFKPGVTLPTFDNVDVHPLMARLLGIAAPQGDGSAKVFETALAAH